MKILFVVESLRSGGKERRLSELILGLSKLNHTIELILMEDIIHYQYIFESNIKIHIIKRKHFKKDPVIFFRFFNIIRNFRPDIIHSWGIMTSFYLLPAKILLKIPLVDSSITNTKPSKLKRIQKLNFYIADLIASNTILGLQTYQVSKQKGVVIYNGFNFNRLNDLTSPIVIREMFNIVTPYIISMVGSFTLQKDYETFILAANQILKKREDVTFLCIGSGDYSSCEILAKDKSKILFLGAQANIESIMNTCDIGVLTSNSKVHGEGVSNALLEFMALGKPVIATNDGGTPELVIQDNSGFLIPYKDFNALQKHIEILLDDSEMRINMGAVSKQIVESRFSIDTMLNGFLYNYNSLLIK